MARAHNLGRGDAVIPEHDHNEQAAATHRRAADDDAAEQSRSKTLPVSAGLEVLVEADATLPPSQVRGAHGGDEHQSDDHLQPVVEGIAEAFHQG